MEIGKRIQAVRRDAGLGTAAFADQIGIAKSSVSRIENGVQEPSGPVLATIAARWSIMEHWLRTGEGPMKAETPSAAPGSASWPAMWPKSETLDPRLVEVLLFVVERWLTWNGIERMSFYHMLRHLVPEFRKWVRELRASGSPLTAYINQERDPAIRRMLFRFAEALSILAGKPEEQQHAVSDAVDGALEVAKSDAYEAVEDTLLGSIEEVGTFLIAWWNRTDEDQRGYLRGGLKRGPLGFDEWCKARKP
jgi:transcriptional regulator with XRE-family HTH domain